MKRAMMLLAAIAIAILALITSAGCASLRQGEGVAVENRVLGMDLSIPIPGTTGVANIANIKIGWIETKYAHAYKASVESTATHRDIHLLTGSGSVKRSLIIAPGHIPQLPRKSIHPRARPCAISAEAAHPRARPGGGHVHNHEQRAAP